MEIHLKKILTEATKWQKIEKWIHSKRSVTKKNNNIQNNPMNTIAPVMKKIKKIKINLMCTTRQVTKEIKIRSE